MTMKSHQTFQRHQIASAFLSFISCALILLCMILPRLPSRRLVYKHACKPPKIDGVCYPIPRIVYFVCADRDPLSKSQQCYDSLKKGSLQFNINTIVFQGIMLQKSLKQDEVDISNKQKQLKRAKEQHAKIQQSLKAQISKLEVLFTIRFG